MLTPFSKNRNEINETQNLWKYGYDFDNDIYIYIYIMIYCTIWRSSVRPASTNWSQEKVQMSSDNLSFVDPRRFFDPRKDSVIERTSVISCWCWWKRCFFHPLACAELTPEYFSKHASPWSQLRAFQWREFRNFGGFEMLRNFCKGRRAATNEADQGACPSCPSKRWIRAAKVHTSYAAGCITVCGPFLQVQRPLLPEITWGNQCILLLRK